MTPAPGFLRWWVRLAKLPLARYWLQPFKPWVSRRVWEWLAEDEEFMEGMRQSQADYEAGRWYSYDPETGESVPNPDWPDGPQP